MAGRRAASTGSSGELLSRLDAILLSKLGREDDLALGRYGRFHSDTARRATIFAVLPDRRLRIWSDRGFVPTGIPHIPLLWPFWGPAVEPKEWRDAGRFDRWAAIGAEFFEFADSPAAADFIVFPLNWNACSGGLAKRARGFGEAARAAGKPLVVFADNDIYHRIPFRDALVFRSALNRSSRQSREWPLPGWVPDIVEELPERYLPLRPHSDVPMAGFCGCVELQRPTLYGRACERWVRMTCRAPENPPPEAVMQLRRKVLRSLEGTSRVKTNYIVRCGYYGGSAERRVGGSCDLANAARARKEYVQNMLASDYNVCVRGCSNFSYRFYETLCCGRIPLFIDTDCTLPFEDRIDWKRYIVLCDERNLADLPARVEEFHRRHTPDSFRALQLDCRRLWEEWLSPAGFFTHLRDELPALATQLTPSA